MKIIIYCQHVLGVGHFFRTLEIVKALKAFDVILVTGGGAVEAKIPSHVRQVKLPGLMMDENFSQLHSVDLEKEVDEVKALRKERLLDLVKDEKPDLFLIELYPFGRRAFRFELVPVLEYIAKEKKDVSCRVVCSLRDILVEKKDMKKYENRVIKALNKWFDAVLIHSDPRFITLDSTFARLDQVNVPLVYTGFVTPVPDIQKVKAFREQAGLGQSGKLIIASAGGGNVGAKLLRAVIQAYQLMYDMMDKSIDTRLQVFTGPYMDDEDKMYLRGFVDERIKVEEFTHDFVSLLGAADLSVSMGGYNTSMNIVAANIPSLIWPFGQNREQRKRAQELARFAPIKILEDDDLAPQRFCRLMEKQIACSKKEADGTLNIQGGYHTAKWIGGY